MQSNDQLEQVVLAPLRQLSPEQQQEVLDFTEFLRQKKSACPPRPRLHRHPPPHQNPPPKCEYPPAFPESFQILFVL